MKPIDAQIDFVISNFDFASVYRVMVCLDWQYAAFQRVPNVGELQKFAERLLHEAVKENTCISSGGFETCYDNESGMLELKFVLEDVMVAKYENSED